MGTFAVADVVREIESRLTDMKAHLRPELKESDANNQLVDLLATVELINRYAASELLSGTPAPSASSGQGPKGAAASKALSDEVLTRLKNWLTQIREALLKLAKALHAKAWSVSIGTPMSFGISLDFEIPNP